MTRFRTLAVLVCSRPGSGHGSAVAAQAPALTPVAPVRSFVVVAEYPHDPAAFTEGLILVDGQLYEGTGLNGVSELRLVDLQTGEVLESHQLSDQYFGEGVTVFGDKIYQLTWQTQTAFVYDRESFEQVGTFSYDTEGWGLTHDGTSLIMSDGSGIRFFFRDPETFEVTKQISVRDGEYPIVNINELEYIDGVLWANVWRTNLIARIDLETGTVIDWLDLTSLQEQVAATGTRIDVLNGIAWNPETDTVYVTGKFWPTLFEIQITDEN